MPLHHYSLTWEDKKVVVDESKPRSLPRRPSGALTVNDVPIHLEQRAFEVLLALLKASPGPVTEGQFLEALWAGKKRDASASSSLHNALSKIRAALTDPEQRLIQAEPWKKRWRIAVPVEKKEIPNLMLEPDGPTLIEGRSVPLPGRDEFLLQKRLGRSDACDVWLGRSSTRAEVRAYTFIAKLAGEERLGAYRRRVELGNGGAGRNAFASAIDWSLSEPPLYIEYRRSGKPLVEWSSGAAGPNSESLAISSLSRADRLAIFAQIADATALAHVSGDALHAVLQPATILLSTEPSAWRVELDPYGDWAELPQAYLAPELDLGEEDEPTPRSDVFALGVLLYQLLTGDLRGAMPPGGWKQKLADDLLAEDIDRATAGDPSERFANAAEFADRVRQLEQRRAQHASETAETRRRQRQRLITRSLIAVSIGFAIVVGLLIETEIARKKALRESARAEETIHFLAHDLLAPEIGNPNPSFREMLAYGSKRLNDRFSDNPATRASIEDALGMAYYNISDYQQAETHFSQAISLLKAFPSGDDGMITTDLEAKYFRALILVNLSRFSEAAALLDEADLEAGGRLKIDSRMSLLAATTRGAYYLVEDDFNSAIPAYQTANRIRKAVAPKDIKLQFEVVGNLAECLIRAERIEEAGNLLQDFLQPRYSPEDVGAPNWLGMRIKIAHLLELQGNFDEAEKVASEAIDGVQGKLPPDSYMFASAYAQLGDIRATRGQFDAALEPLEKAQEIAEKLVGKESQTALIMRMNLGMIEYESGHLDEARRILSVIRSKLATMFGELAPQVQAADYYYAEVLSDSNELTEALNIVSTLNSKALGSMMTGLDWNPRIDALKGEILIRQGRVPEGLALLEPALKKMDADHIQPWVIDPLKRVLTEAKH